MEAGQTWVVAYDISDDGRRAQVANLLSSHGDRIQRSVFVLRLPNGTAPDLRVKLMSMITLATDAVHMIRLCAICQAEVIELGQAAMPTTAECWVVL